MEIKQKSIVSDLASQNKYSMQSSANPAQCVICGKGLRDGFSLTAKSVCDETRFFCELHLN